MDPVFPIFPDPDDARLTRRVRGTDQSGAVTELAVVEERPLTIYLNAQEIVTVVVRTRRGASDAAEQPHHSHRGR